MGVQFSRLANNCVRYVGSGCRPQRHLCLWALHRGLTEVREQTVRLRPSVCTRLGMVWRGLYHYKSPSNGVVAIRSPCPTNSFTRFVVNQQLNISLVVRQNGCNSRWGVRRYARGLIPLPQTLRHAGGSAGKLL